MPTPEHVAALAQLVTHALVVSPTAPKAAKALYAAIVTDPAAQDAVLAALVEGGRLVEQEELVPCPSRHYERDMFGEWCDESCRRFAGHDGDHECVEGRTWPRSEIDPRRRVRFVEPEWREATP
jgi:hypothetical protein